MIGFLVRGRLRIKIRFRVRVRVRLGLVLRLTLSFITGANVGQSAWHYQKINPLSVKKYHFFRVPLAKIHRIKSNCLWMYTGSCILILNIT